MSSVSVVVCLSISFASLCGEEHATAAQKNIVSTWPMSWRCETKVIQKITVEVGLGVDCVDDQLLGYRHCDEIRSDVTSDSRVWRLGESGKVAKVAKLRLCITSFWLVQRWTSEEGAMRLSWKVLSAIKVVKKPRGTETFFVDLTATSYCWGCGTCNCSRVHQTSKRSPLTVRYSPPMAFPGKPIGSPGWTTVKEWASPSTVTRKQLDASCETLSTCTVRVVIAKNPPENNVG